MSYEYLEQGNVIPVRLSKAVARVDDAIVELNPEEKQRVRKIHSESPMIDFHNHLYVLPEDLNDFDTLSRSGRIPTDYEGIKISGMDACFYAMGGLMARKHSHVPWQFEDIVWDMGMRQADLYHHKDSVMLATSVNHLFEAKRNGKLAVFTATENAGVIGNDIDRLDVLYGLGIRCMGLSYNQRNCIADGAKEDADSGLSRFGYKVVERMNRLGMLIDLSHSSEATSRQAIEASEASCCATHSVARAVVDSPKGKSDALIALMAGKGGLIAVQAVPNTTSRKASQSVFDMVDHIDHIVKLVGVDHVAIGTDAMYGDHVAMHKQIGKQMGLTVKEFPADYIQYIENPSQFTNITRALIARGYSDRDIKKIMGGNVIELLKQTIG